MMNHLLVPLMLLLLSACGKTGALYLPDEQAAGVEKTPVENPVTDSEEANRGSL